MSEKRTLEQLAKELEAMERRLDLNQFRTHLSDADEIISKACELVEPYPGSEKLLVELASVRASLTAGIAAIEEVLGDAED